MLSNGHAGCGGRVRETGRPKDRYRALARPYLPGSALPGAGMRGRCGRPTVMGAEVPGGIGVPRKRMPGSRKTAGKQWPQGRDLPRVAAA